MMTHHSVMTSSLRIKFFKIDKFGDFSCDIDYNSRTDVFRDVISVFLWARFFLVTSSSDVFYTRSELCRTGKLVGWIALALEA